MEGELRDFFELHEAQWAEPFFGKSLRHFLQKRAAVDEAAAAPEACYWVSTTGLLLLVAFLITYRRPVGVPICVSLLTEILTKTVAADTARSCLHEGWTAEIYAKCDGEKDERGRCKHISRSPLDPPPEVINTPQKRLCSMFLHALDLGSSCRTARAWLHCTCEALAAAIDNDRGEWGDTDIARDDTFFQVFPGNKRRRFMDPLVREHISLNYTQSGASTSSHRTMAVLHGNDPRNRGYKLDAQLVAEQRAAQWLSSPRIRTLGLSFDAVDVGEPKQSIHIATAWSPEVKFAMAPAPQAPVRNEAGGS